MKWQKKVQLIRRQSDDTKSSCPSTNILCTDYSFYTHLLKPHLSSASHLTYLSPLTFTAILWGWYYYFGFVDGKPEAQRSWVTCWRPQSSRTIGTKVCMRPHAASMQSTAELIFPSSVKWDSHFLPVEGPTAISSLAEGQSWDWGRGWGTGLRGKI